MKLSNIFKILMVGSAIFIYQASYSQQSQQPKQSSNKEQSQQQSKQQQQKEKKTTKKSGQSDWTKEAGIKSTTKNVYFPELDIYYNIAKKVFIYKKKDNWCESTKMPKQLKDVSMKDIKKVEMEQDTKVPQVESKKKKGHTSENTSEPKKEPTSNDQQRPGR